MEVLIVVGFAFAALTGYIAERKGRNPIKWAIFGFFALVLALIIVAIVDDYVPPRERYGTPYKPPYEPDYQDPPAVVPVGEQPYDPNYVTPPPGTPFENGRAQ